MRPEQRTAGYLILPVAGLVVLGIADSLVGTAAAAAAVIGGALLVVWPVPIILAWRRNRAGTQLGETLERILGPARPLNESQQREISRVLADKRLTLPDRKYQTQMAYLRLVLAIVRDRSVTDEELEVLAHAEGLLDLGEGFVGDARADAFREVYLDAIGDGELSEPEQAALDHIRRRLSIPESALKAELEVVHRLREVRKIREGELPVIEPGRPLQKSEACHYEAQARMLKEKNIQSFQRDGQKYNIRGLVVDKEATLLITDKRLLLIHQGTTSVRLDKILDLEVDYDRSLLIVTKDGTRAPVLITTPDALKAGAIVAAAAGL